MKINLVKSLISNYIFVGGRELPTAIIIGTQKGGTSSLFEYMLQHPKIQGSFIKEVQYFAQRYWIGKRGYRSFFPIKKNDTKHLIEATPIYLFYPEAPSRVFELIPNAKLIVLLREPVERAYSNYMHNCRRGDEERTFEDCVAADIEAARKSGGAMRCPCEDDLSFRHTSYVRRGLYAQQLIRWYDLFPRKNIKIFRAEDFFSDPSTITQETLRFLGISEHPINTGKAHNQFSYNRKRLDQFPELADYYREPNEKLKALTGIEWTTI